MDGINGSARDRYEVQMETETGFSRTLYKNPQYENCTGLTDTEEKTSGCQTIFIVGVSH